MPFWPAPGEAMPPPPTNRSKLSFERRCAILVMWRLGVTAPTLVSMFHVSLDTVRAIYRMNSSRYRDVRDHCGRLGEFESTKRYLTRHLVDTANRIQPGAIDMHMEDYARLQP